MITVRFFGTFRLNCGIRELKCEAGSVKELYPAIIAEAKKIKPETNITMKSLKSCIVAVNGTRIEKLNTKLSDGDEVFFFPAVAGG